MTEKQTGFDIIMMTTVHKATDVRIFHREAKTLLGAGLSVCVIGPHPRTEWVDGVMISAIPKRHRRLLRLVLGWTVLKQALQLSGKLHVFHDPELFWVAFGLMVAGKKVVFDCHENPPMQVLHKPWIPKPIRWVLVPAVALALWVGARIISGVIIATESVTKLFPQRRTVLIRNFPAPEGLEISRQGNPTQLRSNIVIYAGGLFRARGIQELVEAFRGINSSAQLWLVGEFEEEEFQRQILDSLPGNVVWHGAMEYPEVLKLYRESKIGAVVLYPTPNHRHSVPTKMLEYLGSGLPVIASDFPEWSDILDGCGVQVDPHDSGQIRDAIQRLLANDSRIAEMSAVACERIMKQFTWKDEGQKLVDYCSRLIYG